MSAPNRHPPRSRQALPIHLSPDRYQALWAFCKREGHSLESGIASLIDQNLNPSTTKFHG